MESFNKVYRHLIDEVYSDDMDAQLYYLSMVEEQRHIPVSYLLQRGALFIPNNEYIHHYIGSEADQYNLELYSDGRCNWTCFVVLPVTDLTGDVVGLSGWDAQHKFEEIQTGQWGMTMYKVSSKVVFPREKHFLTDVDVLKETFDSRTIFVVDGTFDSVSLNYRGIPAIALLGSSFSQEILYFLRWYKKIYVVADNDDAGLKLYKRMSKSLPNVHRVIQGETKDIEELLRTDGIDGPVTSQLKEAMKPYFKGDVRLDTREYRKLQGYRQIGNISFKDEI